MGIPGTKIQFCTEAHTTEVFGLSSINCPHCQDNCRSKISIWRGQRLLFLARDDFFSVGSVHFVRMRWTIVKIIQPSFIRLLSSKLSSAIKLDFDTASGTCELSGRCLGSSVRSIAGFCIYLPRSVVQILSLRVSASCFLALLRQP